jgi:hypothetical protein
MPRIGWYPQIYQHNRSVLPGRLVSPRMTGFKCRTPRALTRPVQTSRLSDAKVTDLRLATTETWKDRDTGERKERTERHRVTAWGDGFANYLTHATESAMLLIEGSLRARKWTDVDAQGPAGAIQRVLNDA